MFCCFGFFSVNGLILILRVYLCKHHHPLPVRPDDVVHLRAHPLPGQLRAAKTRLRAGERRMSPGAAGQRNTTI